MSKTLSQRQDKTRQNIRQGKTRLDIRQSKDRQGNIERLGKTRFSFKNLVCSSSSLSMRASLREEQGGKGEGEGRPSQDKTRQGKTRPGTKRQGHDKTRPGQTRQDQTIIRQDNQKTRQDKEKTKQYYQT
jgi:hypothetical protein